jgi:hypothetical protein
MEARFKNMTSGLKDNKSPKVSKNKPKSKAKSHTPANKKSDIPRNRGATFGTTSKPQKTTSEVFHLKHKREQILQEKFELLKFKILRSIKTKLSRTKRHESWTRKTKFGNPTFTLPGLGGCRSPSLIP